MVTGDKQPNSTIQQPEEISVLPESEIVYNITRKDLKELPTKELVQLLGRMNKMKDLVVYEVRKRMQI